MADIADLTQAREEALDSVRRKSEHSLARVRELEPNGECWECGEDVPINKLFCDKDCSDMYEARKKARLRAEGAN